MKRRFFTTMLLTAAVLALAGCGFSTPSIWLEVPRWFNTHQILIPFEVSGTDRVALVEYTLERSDPFIEPLEWILDEGVGVRQIRIASGSSGILTFDVWEDYWEYRLTMTLLGTNDASAVARPVLTVAKTFRIDSYPPDWYAEGFGFDDIYYLDGEMWPAPGMMFSPGEPIDVDILDSMAPGLLDSFGGSPVRLYYTDDGTVPHEGSPSIDTIYNSIDFTIWAQPGGTTLKMILIDEAGNRSSVLTVFYPEGTEPV